MEPGSFAETGKEAKVENLWVMCKWFCPCSEYYQHIRITAILYILYNVMAAIFYTAASHIKLTVYVMFEKL